MPGLSSRAIIPACLLALSFLSSAAFTQNMPPTADDALAVPRRIIAAEREHSQVLENLEYLSDLIGPRLTGSQRLLDANKWTLHQMTEYGLENPHLEAYTIPRTWERGKVEARIVAPTVFPVIAAQYAWTPGTRGKITAPVVLFMPDTEAELASYKGKLKGAIVLSLRKPAGNPPDSKIPLPDEKPAPPIPAFAAPPAGTAAVPTAAPTGMEQEEDGQPPADPKRPVLSRRKIADFLQSEGVAAVLLDANKPHGLLNMTGSWTNTQDYPTLFVAHEQVALLQRLLKRNMPVKMELKVECRITKKPVTVYNTVCEIRGSEKPDEIVLLGAHLDSWDLGQGSTDNGTGAMAVLETARLFKALHLAPKRTVRFVLFSGEEEGLYGSKAYVAAHKAEREHFSVVFVHDTGTGRVRGLWLQNRAEDKPLLAAQFETLKTLGLLTEDANLLPGKMNGTDHASFDDAGVPAFAFNQDADEYSMTHHSQSDTFDKVRPDDLKQGGLRDGDTGLQRRANAGNVSAQVICLTFFIMRSKISFVLNLLPYPYHRMSVSIKICDTIVFLKPCQPKRTGRSKFALSQTLQ